jgi:DNA topoisomerase IB
MRVVSGLVRSDPDAAGIRHRRCGRGFQYLRPDGTAVRDPGTIARIRSLVIPSAWQDVWICPDPARWPSETGHFTVCAAAFCLSSR